LGASDREKKRKSFDKEFTALGIVVDLNQAQEGNIKFRNKPGRIEAIGVQVNGVLRTRRLGFKDALSIRGKLAFAEGRNYGRISSPVAHILSRWTKEGGIKQVSDELEQCLNWTINEIKLDIPRTIGPQRKDMPVLIFTDGACEPDLTSVGGVMISQGEVVQCFGMELPAKFIDSWKSRESQTQVIGQAELLPVLVAKWTWR